MGHQQLASNLDQGALNWLWLLGARLDRVVLAGTPPEGLEELLAAEGAIVERAEPGASLSRAAAGLALLLPDGRPTALPQLRRALGPGGVLAVACGRRRAFPMAARLALMRARERRHYCLWPSLEAPRRIVPASRQALDAFVGLPQSLDRYTHRRERAIAFGLYGWAAPGHLFMLRP